MRIHILGICGTFMGGLAMLARYLGHEVTGSDANSPVAWENSCCFSTINSPNVFITRSLHFYVE